MSKFLPSRGIRQGDPILPYLFVLCIKRLFQLINHVVELGHWIPIRFSRFGPKLSHLAFADDLLLFAKATMDQAETLKKVMNVFCLSSGQEVSEEKTVVYFSTNVLWQQRDQIVSALDYQRMTNLGKYLGVPLHHDKGTKQSYQCLMDKMNQWLNNWKVSRLSLAGRVTLPKGVVQAFPTYVMQTNLLPISVCNEIDKKCWSFVWGDMTSTKKVRWLNWNACCMPKRSDSFGLRKATSMNQAMLSKVGWNLCNHPNDLWMKVVRVKYKYGIDVIPNISSTRQGTNLWRGIVKTWSMMSSNMIWHVGSKRRIFFLGRCLGSRTRVIEPVQRWDK